MRVLGSPEDRTEVLITKSAQISTSRLKPLLRGCGYRGALLQSNFPFGDGGQAQLVGFARKMPDARSACIAVLRGNGNPAQTVDSCRALGAPVVFVFYPNELQWWSQEPAGPREIERLTPAQLDGFFTSHKKDFAPETVYRAKTLAHVKSEYQLSFVDVGLIPLVEQEIGERLSDLIVRCAGQIAKALWGGTVPQKGGDWLFRSVFWLLAAKILGDKDVPGFASLDLADVDLVLRRVGEHYGSSARLSAGGARRQTALSHVAGTISRFSNLRLTTPESLAYVYENALVNKETRVQLGVHSTPAYLVDYVLSRLEPWIERIPPDERKVFEPACGHAAFLVAAMRLLKDLLPENQRESPSCHRYVCDRLRGCEIDGFALEIARLSLTLADAPNRDGWRLDCVDMFQGDILEKRAKEASIVLANPPFEKFTAEERQEYGTRRRFLHKTAEMLCRVLTALRPRSVLGLVAPQGLLKDKNAAALREQFLNQFDIQEICLFPDKVFKFSDMETAVIIARKRDDKTRPPSGTLRFARVRESGVDRFKANYSVTSEQTVRQDRFTSNDGSSMVVPDLDEVWQWCQAMPTLASVAHVGRGLSFKGRKRIGGAVTISDKPFPGAVRGYSHVGRDLMIHGAPEEVYMSLDPEVVFVSRSGVQTGRPQVLMSYAPVSRGPWRIKAVIDRKGRAVRDRFLAIRPNTPQIALEFLWAVLNSPLANAYAYAHASKRDIPTGLMRQLPIPDASPEDIRIVAEAARSYLSFVAPPRGLSARDQDRARALLLAVDAQVLRLYDLPPRLEREVLDLFAGQERKGVPFRFDRYFPDDYEPCFPLHEYLSAAYQRSTAGALRRRCKPVTDPVLLEALDAAVRAFEE